MEKVELRGKGDGVRISVKENTPVYTMFSQIITIDTMRPNRLHLLQIIAKLVKTWMQMLFQQD